MDTKVLLTIAIIVVVSIVGSKVLAFFLAMLSTGNGVLS